MDNLKFRQARPEEATRIWEILSQAISRRKKDGSAQWQDGYPNPQTVENDIANGNGFVLMRDNAILGYAALIYNNEPAYNDIEGNWLTDNDFYVIHRVAVADEALGNGYAQEIFRRIEAFVKEQSVKSIRVDTNFDNPAMLNIFTKLGYTYCGEVYFRGSPRKAYEKVIG